MKQKLTSFVLAIFAGILPLYAFVPKQMTPVAEGDVVKLSITKFTAFDDKDITYDPPFWFVAGNASDNYEFQLFAPGTSVSSTFTGVYISTSDPESLTYLKKDGVLVPIESGYGNAILYDDNLTLDFYLIGKDKTVYHITCFDPFALDETTTFNGSFQDTEFQVDTKYFTSNKVVILKGINSQNYYIELMFFVNALDPDITIPAGVYTIDDTEQPGTMQASPGELMNNGTYITGQSFAATLNAAGTAIEKEWLITGGTATVTNDSGKLRVAINATNSQGKTVTIEVVGMAKLPTGIDDATATPQIQKVMYNGEIRILMPDGKMYDATGVQVR